jgi:ATP-dependent DNA helicase RecQ
MTQLSEMRSGISDIDTSELLVNAKKLLKDVFGYTDFRGNQWEVIQSVLQGQDALVLMPTGGGKSLCFQIPALLNKGTAIVVSPLISLMKDQVEALQVNGVAADYLNSSQSELEQNLVTERLLNDEIKLLYVSPEKFISDIFISIISSIKLSLVAIDEAHCISSWGHDFRPEYGQIGKIRPRLMGVPFMALTATADKLTRRDIINQLSLDYQNEFISSFDRPNLSLTVLPGKQRWDKILALLSGRKNTSGIIYCTSRKSCESLAEKLVAAGYDAEPYHAGLHADLRSKTQEAFTKDELPIVVATVAFGMGIDKSNVRWIIHYNLPKNLESYYQEIGRAGRDGLDADTFLFSTYADVLRIKEFIENSGQKEFQEAKLQRLMDYTDSRICRRKVLLAYFGEIIQDDCNNCDVCKNPPEVIDGTLIAQKALSAIVRVKQCESLLTIVEILKASTKAEIYQKGYQNLKTFGAGKDIPFSDWQQYMMQLINLGYIEIAYDEGHSLKVTPLGKKVLFENASVDLVKLDPKKLVKDAPKTQKSGSTTGRSFRKVTDEELFQKLRQVRIKLAKEQNKAPYMIFSDATLNHMCRDLPTNDDEMILIEGVGNYKMEQYGDFFINEIVQHLRK